MSPAKGNVVADRRTYVGLARAMLDTLPGLALCLIVMAAALVLQMIEERVIGQPYVEALVLAILVGVALRTARTPPAAFRPGIDLSAKLLLEVAVMLLGASVSVQAVLAIGPAMIGGIALVVVVAIGASIGICRLLGLPLTWPPRSPSPPCSASWSSWVSLFSCRCCP